MFVSKTTACTIETGIPFKSKDKFSSNKRTYQLEKQTIERKMKFSTLKTSNFFIELIDFFKFTVEY